MVKCPNQKWFCNACGKESNSDDWTLIMKEVEDPIITEDALVLKCPNPNCGGSEVYKYVGHSHIKAKSK